MAFISFHYRTSKAWVAEVDALLRTPFIHFHFSRGGQCLPEYEYRRQRFRIEVITTHHSGCGQWPFRCDNVLPMTVYQQYLLRHITHNMHSGKRTMSLMDPIVFVPFQLLLPITANMCCWTHANMLHIRHSNTKTMRRKLPWRPTIPAIPFHF